MIKNYLNKFSLKNKKAFVIGGSGLLGSEIIEALVSASANVINLDKNKKIINFEKKFAADKYKFIPIDVSDLKNIDKKISNLFKKFGCPDILINCSYPVTKNWVKVHLVKINYLY